MSGMIGSTKLDPRIETVAGGALPEAPNNSFQQGLRQGFTSAGGQLHALAGGVGEALGADDFARAQYAKSAAAQAEAATQAPEINSWQQVTNAPDLSTGLRNAGSYVAGLAGNAAPAVALGGAAGALTGGGALPMFAAGTAAVAPLEMGGAIQRQQAGPAVLAKNGAGLRLGAAALEGVGRSAAMMAVPQFMGSKLLGKVGAGAAESMPMAIAKNLAEGVGGNALGGAAAEQISNTVNDQLDPNRDTSGDNARMLDAAISGGALGVPFAGMGVAAHALHGKGPAPRTDGVPVPGMDAAPESAPVPKASLMDRAKGLFAKRDDSVERIANDGDVIDVEALKNADPAMQGKMLDEADAGRMEKAKTWAGELLAGDKLSPENREKLTAAAQDLSSRASQNIVAGVKLATDAGSRALNAATEFYNAISKKDEADAPAAPEGIKLSSIGAGAEKAIGDVVEPHLDAKYPDLMKNDAGRKAVTGTLRRVMDTMQKTGEIDHDTAEHLHNWFGDDTPAVLADLHDKVMSGGDQRASDRYFGALNKLTDDIGSHGKLEDQVRAALLPELQDHATPEDIRSATKLMREYATGDGLKDLPPAEQAFRSKQIEAAMRAHFGDKTDKLVGAFMADAKGREKTRLEMEQSVDGVTDKDKLDEGGFDDTPEAGVTKETDKIYYGGGNDKDNPTFVLSERAHSAKYGGEGQAARLLKDVRAKHPDMNVSTVPAEIYARDHGWGKQQLMDATNGSPRDHVMIQAEGIKRDGLSWNDVERMKNDSHNYSDSPSKIHTDAGITLDAVKVMKHYNPDHVLAYNDTDTISKFHRMARQFREGINAISDHLGELVEVPDDTVVARGKGGQTLTWGELQKKARIKAEPSDALYASREAAVKAGDHEAVAEADAVHDERVMNSNDPKDELLDGQPKVTNPTAIKAEHAAALGDIKMRAAIEAEKRGPLRGPDGAQIRPLSMVERKLAREYETLAREVEFEQGKLGMGGEVHAKDTGFNAEGKRVATESSAARKAKDASFTPERAATPERIAKDGTRIAARDAVPAQFHAGEGDFRSYMNMESASWGGKGDVAPTDQIHMAAKHLGEDLPGAFKGSNSMEAGKETNMLHADNFFTPKHPTDASGKVARFDRDGNPDGSLTANTISAIENRVQQFEIGKSAAARAVGEKGRNLVELVKSGQMKMQDAALLASIIKDKSGASRAAQINELAAKYEGVAVQPKKPSAFVERVVGKGDVDGAVKAIAASNDPIEVRRAVDALAPHQMDASAREVLRVANNRIETLLAQHPDAAYNMQRASATSAADATMRANIVDHINKVLGKTVDVEFAKMLHAGEFVRDPSRVPAGMAQDVIRVSVHALDPMGTAHHESLHAFFAKLADAGLRDAAHPLFKAADSARVRRQLETLLAGEPDALKQLADPEERAAYMYQFWQAGKLDLTGKPQGVIEHIASMFRKVLGVWTNDQRAEHIMDYFASGTYARDAWNDSAVKRALEKNATPTLALRSRLDAFKSMVGPLDTLAQRVALSGDANIRSFKNAALDEVLNKVYSPMQGEHTDVGYAPAARAKRGQILNDLAADLHGIEPAVITDALKAMQQGGKGATPVERQVVLRVRKMLDSTFEYMRSKGVVVNNLGYGKDYFPRVWDTNKILSNEPAFRAMMDNYVKSGEFKGDVNAVIATLTRNDGSDLQVETAKPGMQHARERVLSFISGADAQPFLNDNLYHTLNSYVTQATRRAEWADRFGDDGAILKQHLDDAEKSGATPEQIAMTHNYLKSVDGTLGDKIDPKLRRAFGNMIVYQNIRILPLAIFSSLIDPGGVLVRGGTAGEAWNVMKRGFAEIPKGFKKVGQETDDATRLAAQLGVIDSAVLRHSLGSSFSQGMTSNLGRKVNDTFFKYNLMEQFNTSMRVGATEAALGFLGRHADGTNSQHSARWLAELGLKPNEIKLDAEGRPLLHAKDLIDAGMKPKDAQALSDKMTLAVNKWVDGAILRPNAAHKPMWMSDPHFALVSHLKQFVYSFQETILKRVANEAKYGNFGPAYSLAAYVPFMLAADLAKGMIVGGGSQPASRQNWDAGDYAWYEMQRAGLFGVGQFGIDAIKDLHRGGMGIGALSGPTIEQLGEAASVVGGPEQFKTFALNSLPANQLVGAAESAATNAMD